jgi:hypothetical protein
LRVTKELQDIHGAIIADPTIVVMGEVIESKPYSHQRVSEWVKTYGANHEIVGQLYEKIKSLLETRILSQAMKGRVKPLMAIFCLKNLYGYKDPAELELTGNVTSTIIERKIELPVKKDEMTPVTPKGQK